MKQISSRRILCAGILAALCLSAVPRAVVPPILPDARLTPGAVLDVTRDDVCTPGYTKRIRDVPKRVRDQVFAEYGITSRAPGEYEVDHLISLELGGSNSIKNLWPQSYRTQPWNAHVKDRLENLLHQLVCSGQIDLKDAQKEIAANWIKSYQRRFHTDLPLAKGVRQSRRTRATGSASVASPQGQVWVNTRSGKYFVPGSRWYGKTREGEYMSKAEALRRGYVAAKGF
jgi:hypothetical protein